VTRQRLFIHSMEVKAVASQQKVIDVRSIPELERLLAEQGEVVLVRSGEHEAIVHTRSGKMPKRTRKGRATSETDPLWRIVGMADSHGPGDIAENVDAYLAKAQLASDR
jgi:hypothetical protein